MAESAVNIVINYLGPLLQEKLNLLSGVDREFEWIKGELEIIKPYLKDADERAERGDANDGVKALVKQVRKVSYRIEDAIDEYILHLQTQRFAQRCEFIRCLYKVARSIIRCKPQQEIASEIQEIKTTLQHIHELRDRYGLRVIEEGSSSHVKDVSTWHDPRVASLFLEEVEVVGIESPRAELTTLMAEEASSRRRVISVVGEGGLGKTTLVKKVYDDQIASKNFACHAWITVSQSPPNQKELLRTLMKKFYETASKGMDEESLIRKLREIETVDEESLIGKLREYLHQRRYVVVFDDVWDIHFWNFIKLALPDYNKGSRVLITTRKKDVAISCIEYKIFDKMYELERLPHEKAWELFCKNAFKSDSCPNELKKLSDEIVKKCNGVPLAIVTIGRLLSTKNQMALEWQKFHNRLGSELKSNPRLEDVKKIILFSYLDLPYHLRACFLYFGIFPEDYYIQRGRLIRLWIAEGFVKEDSGKTLEESAKEYLQQLIHRSLVQSSLDYDYFQKNQLCRVHDIIREIILLKHEDLLLAKDDSISDDGQFRRLSIHNKIEDNVMNNITKSKMRSVVTFGKELPESFTATLMTNFKLLKVLDFQGATGVNSLPEEVGNLLHLSYLSLRDTGVQFLPKSIGKLRYLLTLDLKNSCVDVLPIEINRLAKLRHLLVLPRNSEALKIQEGFGCLKNLQKLSSVELAGSLVEELIMLRQLRKLGILKLKKEQGKDVCIAVENMSHLESLRVFSNKHEILDLQYITSPPDSLQRLALMGCLEKFPEWISKLQNLVSIVLANSRLKEDPLKFLQSLPSLLVLHLLNAYDGDILHFEGGGFQKLKQLHLNSMDNLISVEVDAGALPLLQTTIVMNCRALEKIPKKIEKVLERQDTCTIL